MKLHIRILSPTSSGWWSRACTDEKLTMSWISWLTFLSLAEQLKHIIFCGIQKMCHSWAYNSQWTGCIHNQSRKRGEAYRSCFWEFLEDYSRKLQHRSHPQLLSLLRAVTRRIVSFDPWDPKRPFVVKIDAWKENDTLLISIDKNKLNVH
jgi:hypothetical protein